MPSSRLVRSRVSGWCAWDFAHPGAIQPGDLVLVTTYFPRDEHVRDFGVQPFTRIRICAWCVQREITSGRLRDPKADGSGS